VKMWLLQGLLFGVFGLLVEDFFTGVKSFLRGDRRGTTTSYLYMPFVWAVGGWLFAFLEPSVAAIPWLLARWVAWVLLIYVLEALSGALLKKFLGLVPWDYSDSKGAALGGTVNLWYIPFWLLLGIGVQPALHFVAWMAGRLLQ